MTIWVHPRDTVRKIILANPELHVVLLACLTGIGEAFNRVSIRNMGDQYPMVAVIALACLGGPLGGLFSLWLSSHLLHWTGRWIGGAAPREHLKTAIAWASVPFVTILPLWIPKLLVFGSELFSKNTPRLDAQPLLLVPLLAVGLVEMGIGLWSFVLLCHTVAEVQGFRSGWRGFCNVFFSGAVIIGPILLLALPLLFLR